MHAVAAGAGQRPAHRARRLQQALVFVGGQARRAVGPEARGKRGSVSVQRRIAPQRRALDGQVVAGDEGVAVRQERADVVGQPLPVTAPAQVGGASGRQAGRVDDRGVGGSGRQQAGPVEDGLQPTDRLAGVGICIRDQRRERELLAVQRVQQAAQGRELPDFLVLAVGRGNRGDDFAE